MQRLKLIASARASSLINVGERAYFKRSQADVGGRRRDFCNDSPCTLESVWSLTTGGAQAVLAKELDPKMDNGPESPKLAVAAISFPMRSLIGPVLPPGFAFAVIDDSGNVLFHSDRQRNGNEKFFVETDNNRRLRAQVAAHSADALNINYWGARYRAYVKPMQLPGMYVVAMAQTERAWAINREWLVVTFTLLAAYSVVALARDGDSRAKRVMGVARSQTARALSRGLDRVHRAARTCGWCGSLWNTERYRACRRGVAAHRLGRRLLLLKSPSHRRRSGGRETLVAYTVASGTRAAGGRRDPWLDALSRFLQVTHLELHHEQPAHGRTPACEPVRPIARGLSAWRQRELPESGGVAHQHRFRPRYLRRFPLRHVCQSTEQAG